MRKIVEERLKQFQAHSLHIGSLKRLVYGGEEYTKMLDYAPVNEWAKRRKPKLKQCFANCQHAIIDRVPRVRYCEGFIFIGNNPIHHAWLVVGKSVVEITRTYKNLAKAFKKHGRVYKEPENPPRYFGIKFTHKQVEDHLLRQDFFCGLLDL